MARVTVEDCVTVIPNRFELCLVASNRAKSILSGASTNFSRKEKPAVISLREIADKAVDIENIEKNIIKEIKNRGVSDYEELLANEAAVEIIPDEIDNENIVLKDNIFVEDNIEIDD